MSSETNTFRAFIAMELPDEIRESVYRSLNPTMNKLAQYVKWVEQNNLHLTLRFLGQIDSNAKDKIENYLSQVTNEYSPMSFSLDELGVFPNWREPRILWIGIHVLSGELISLQKEIESIAQRAGLKPENQRFHPHITIGRVKSTNEFVARCWRATKLPQIPPFRISDVILFKSTLHPSGPIYDPVKKFQLLLNSQKEII